MERSMGTAGSRIEIRNARVVTPDEILVNHTVVIEEEWITEVIPSSGASAEAGVSDGTTVIDADGAYLMPGFIDIHADYIEHMAAPRPTSVMDLRLSLREAERELITHGITTMYHSLALYDHEVFGGGPIRSPESTKSLIELIDTMHDSEHLIRHRFHARYEIDNIGRVEELLSYIDSRTVHLVSFMDHTPGQGQYRDLEVFRHTLRAYRKLSDTEIDRLIAKGQAREKLTIERLAQIATRATAQRIAVASHDDDSEEKLDLVSGIGATISEFPITLEVARRARRMGMHTVAGAPNILLGGSHSGNLSATEAVLDGSVDVLSSDYYPAALLHAVFRMHTDHDLPLPRLVRLVTLNPAKAVLLGEEYGSVEVGKRADLIVVDELPDGFPAVTAAIVDGVRVFESRYRRTRPGREV